METIFGDGSQQQGGFMGALMGAGKRLLTGESLFMTVFLNRSGQKRKVAFGAPYPGKIMPVHLAEIGGELIAQKDSFLAAAKGVSVGIAFQKKLGVGLFGGEGFIMQRLQGDGWAFVHAGGTLHERTLAPGEVIRVDTGCIVAFQPSVNYDIQYVGKIKSALFGGEGLFFATLRGPGRVWLQSLPLSRLANRIIAAVPGLGEAAREEGRSSAGSAGCWTATTVSGSPLHDHQVPANLRCIHGSAARNRHGRAPRRSPVGPGLVDSSGTAHAAPADGLRLVVRGRTRRDHPWRRHRRRRVPGGPCGDGPVRATMLWVIGVAVRLQTLLNIELMRYTLATGEPVFTGFMRTRPPSTLWAWFYAILYFLQIGWPALAANAAGAAFFLFAPAPPRSGRYQSGVCHWRGDLPCVWFNPPVRPKHRAHTRAPELGAGHRHSTASFLGLAVLYVPGQPGVCCRRVCGV